MTLIGAMKKMMLAGTAVLAGGCVAYPDGTVAVLTPPPLVTVAPAPVVVAAPPPVIVAPTPVVVARPVYAPVVVRRAYYRPYTWGGGYRGGTYSSCVPAGW